MKIGLGMGVGLFLVLLGGVAWYLVGVLGTCFEKEGLGRCFGKVRVRANQKNWIFCSFRGTFTKIFFQVRYCILTTNE